ncbi:conserved Plasmodium protein, unknown function [Plasmodium vinckei brucechwatti]|uniref:Uncharacterized protein n=1 Tax=Plasmodium vinckei brucechwatti TaxID=119398 RepID=A0A6V7SJ83_PLAVN|nr:conserved Plasmodium protein, unknown function [Plasmodium vinckei brucechwatti]
MSFNKFNEKKRYFNMHGENTNSANFNYQVPPPPPNSQNDNPLLIPQNPFPKKPRYPPNMNGYNYRNNNNNKRFMKKKKHFHNFPKNSNNECIHLKEALVNPWLHLYAKHPNFNFF